MKKLLTLLTLLALIIVGGVLAQDADDSTDDNWCYEGQAWGDGRCNDPDPSINLYNWVAGWCHAQVENGNFEGTFYACMGLPEPVEGEDIAVNDSYSTDNETLDCGPDNAISAPGVLLNDIGDNIEVISNTALVGLGLGTGTVTINANGGFSIDVSTSDIYRFTYTITGGSTATVTLNVCDGEG